MSRQGNHQPIGVGYKHQTLDWGALGQEEKAGTLSGKRAGRWQQRGRTRAACATEGAQEGSFHTPRASKRVGRTPLQSILVSF